MSSGLPQLPPRAGLTAVPPNPSFSGAGAIAPDVPTYTVDQAIDHIGLGPFQYVVLLLAGFAWTAESMEMLLLSFIKQPLQCEWGISDSQAALITTSVAAGMLTGSTAWGLFADRFGRRNAFVVSNLFLMCMGIASGLAVNYPMMLITRGLVGVGVGGVPVAFSLLMEFLPSAQRGSWGLSLAMFWALGAVFEAVVAMYVLPALNWRWLIIVSTTPLILVVCFSFWLSESPRWLATRGHEEKVRQVLDRIARVNGNPLPDGRVTLISEESTMQDDLETGTDSTVPTNPRHQQPADPFTARDALISAPISPATAAGYAGSADIASDSASAPLTPRTAHQPSDDAEHVGNEQEPLEEGWTESRPWRKGGVADLLRPGARQLAFWIFVGWFVNSFIYYGLIMLQPELIAAENTGQRCSYTANECARLTKDSTCNALPLCSWLTNANTSSDVQCIPTEHTSSHEKDANGVCALALTRDDFISTLWGSIGEMPGVMIAFVIVDMIGRRPLLGYYYIVLFLGQILLLFCTSRYTETVTFFFGRGASSGAFQAMYLYTNEIYPSSIRATAMGLSSSMSRVGLLLTPFVAQYLLNINETTALGIYAALCAVGVVSIVLSPIETTGRPLFSSMDELVQTLREARLRGNDVGTSFADDPSVNRFVRMFRWRATLDGISVK